jgi:hypothetical protein
MTQTPTGIYDSYEAEGLREDISDLIFNISPTETPFLSAIGTTTAGQRYHQWQKDVLATPAADNAKWEGEDATFTEATPTEVVGNYTQISTKVINVTGTLEVTEKYGRDSEIAYLAAKAARELKTDVDTSMLSNNPSLGATAAARLSGGMAAWLETNTVFNTAGTPGADGGFAAGIVAARTDNAALLALTQAMIDTVMQSAWANGGKPSMLLCGPVQKTAISTFDGVGGAGTSGVTRSDRAGRTIYATADLYVSNFGELRVVPTRHIRVTAATDRELYLVDPEYAKAAYLRPWQQFDLAKTGDSIKREMLVEWALEVCNEAAHGGVFDLTVQ